MRLITCLLATILVASLNSLAVQAQPTDEQTEPYHKHRDMRYGHDHIYPDRGAVIRDLPRGAVVVNYAGITFHFDGGVWYEPRGPAYIVVDPPIGLLVPALPGFATPVMHAGETYMYANNVYYRARPELGGYEVVNEPAEAQPAEKAAGGSTAMPGAGGSVVSSTPSGSPRSNGAGGSVESSAPAPALASAAALGSAAAVATPTSAGSAVPAASPPAVAPAGVTPNAALSAQTFAPASAPSSTTTGVGSTSADSPVAGASSAVPTSMGASPNTTPLTAGQTSPSATIPISASHLGAGPVSAPAPAAVMPAAAGAGASLSGASVAAAGSSTTAAQSPSLSVSQMGPKVFIYPRSGQNTDQQAHDRYECYRFAVAQTGYDPMRSGTAAQTQHAEQQSDYERAQAACLEGRGYSVR